MAKQSIIFRGKRYIKPRATWNGMIKDFKKAGYSVRIKKGSIYVRPTKSAKKVRMFT